MLIDFIASSIILVPLVTIACSVIVSIAVMVSKSVARRISGEQEV